MVFYLGELKSVLDWLDPVSRASSYSMHKLIFAPEIIDLLPLVDFKYNSKIHFSKSSDVIFLKTSKEFIDKIEEQNVTTKQFQSCLFCEFLWGLWYSNRWEWLSRILSYKFYYLGLMIYLMYHNTVQTGERKKIFLYSCPSLMTLMFLQKLK